jgi:hypothetical protein
MQQVQTHIDIEAPAQVVWAILADFGMYRRWNPLIRGVLGRPAMGRQIEVQLRAATGADIAARLTIVAIREDREMKWLECWAMPALFASERRFWIEPRSGGGVRFHHGEQARGIMVPLLRQRRRLRSRPGIDAMNTALKQRAERAWANRAPVLN